MFCAVDNNSIAMEHVVYSYSTMKWFDTKKNFEVMKNQRQIYVVEQTLMDINF